MKTFKHKKYLFDLTIFFPECRNASLGSPCTNVGTGDCKYELTSGEHCCCGQCSSWLSLACVLNSTSGAGVWQISSGCPVDGCDSKGDMNPEQIYESFLKTHSFEHFFTGVLSSPNYPGNYPNNLDRTESIQVKSGKILRIEFTHFDVYYYPNCSKDYVKITDGDGTTLMDRSCGYSTSSSSSFFTPPIITTKTNNVNIYFHSVYTRSGWSLNWTAITPG